MVKKLTLAEQRRIYNSMPAYRRADALRVCKECNMRGEGVMSTLKKVGGVLGEFGKVVGPVVLKEVLPIVIKSVSQTGAGRAPAKKPMRPTPRKTVKKKTCF